MTPTTFFPLKNNALFAESVALSEIAARFGTPCYVYSRAALEAAYRDMQQALAGADAHICFAVKACANLAVLNIFSRMGASFDLVSQGEMARAIAAGGDPSKMVFSGVAKKESEILYALSKDIFCFNVESASELLRIQTLAKKVDKKARVSLRVNPDVDPKTHPYISTGLKENKFGIAYDEALDLYQQAASFSHIELAGIDCHIGSQILEVAPFEEALAKLLSLVSELKSKGIALSHIDLGGGLGIPYREGEVAPSAAAYLAPILAQLKGKNLKLILEPGRSLVGNAGVLLTQVEYLKEGAFKNFAILDAGMNDLMRPALYDAFHDIRPIKPRVDAPKTWEMVGPICESSDFLGHDRSLALAEGDYLAILSAGAYGMSMSSTYNARPKAAEVMVDGEQFFCVRPRETIEELYAKETLLP